MPTEPESDMLCRALPHHRNTTGPRIGRQQPMDPWTSAGRHGRRHRRPGMEATPFMEPKRHTPAARWSFALEIQPTKYIKSKILTLECRTSALQWIRMPKVYRW
jgi:hypothetical protein